MSERSRKQRTESSGHQALFDRLIRETAEASGENETDIRNVVEAFLEVAAYKISQGYRVPAPGGGWLRAGVVNGEIQMVFEPERGE